MERAGADLHVVGLQDDAALLAPELLQRQDQVLKGLPWDAARQGVRPLLRPSWWRTSFARSGYVAAQYTR